MGLDNLWFMKKCLNSDGQPFHKYQRNEESPEISNCLTQKRPHISLQIQVIPSDMIKKVAGFNSQKVLASTLNIYGIEHKNVS